MSYSACAADAGRLLVLVCGAPYLRAQAGATCHLPLTNLFIYFWTKGYLQVDQRQYSVVSYYTLCWVAFRFISD
jgi:hypothetical protein